MIAVAVLQLGCATADLVSPTGDAECAYDRSQMMELDPAAFDATLHSGWRVIGDIPGCDGFIACFGRPYRVAYSPECQAAAQ
jgi:hypothetical protein